MIFAAEQSNKLQDIVPVSLSVLGRKIRFVIILKMSLQNENFGIMDEGYFVPRGEILSWLNGLLQVRSLIFS